MSGDILKKKIKNNFKNVLYKTKIFLRKKIDKYLIAINKNLKKIIKKYKTKTKEIYIKVKNNFMESKNRKKYLVTTSILIIINLLIINIFISFGYYTDNVQIPLIRAKVGNMNLQEYDYTVLVYLESTDSQGNGNGNYELSGAIPAIGYAYSGYQCDNNSTLIYDADTMTTSVTTDHKERCSVYFDIVGSLDLSIKIMIEEMPGSDTYILSNQVPAFGYKYSHYECTNGGTLEYNSTLHKVKLSTSEKEYCNMYFTKEESDITVNLFVESEINTENYIERLNIPSNTLYEINQTRSVCTNNNNERVDTSITFTDGYIETTLEENATCDIYLDVTNE